LHLFQVEGSVTISPISVAPVAPFKPMVDLHREAACESALNIDPVLGVIGVEY